MKTFTIGDYSADWDDTFKPGDLITTYNAGYHEFIRYDERIKDAPLVYYKLKYKVNGQSVKSKVEQSCDAAYCRRAEQHIAKTIDELETTIKKLKEIKSKHGI